MAEARPNESAPADLLIEIGCEELPAGAIVPLAEHLGRGLHAALESAGLAGGEPVTFATPRRLAARLPAVGARQPDRSVERKGPALAAAYDEEGAPTKALQGFLRSAGAEVADLDTVETPKGAWVVLTQRQPGRALAEVVAEALPAIVQTMPMPRRMRWGAGEAEFLRPIAWLLAMHGAETLPLELFGLAAGAETRGHRFHAPGPFTLADAADYEATLERAYVVADVATRRERIVAGVREAVERFERGEGRPSAETPSGSAPRTLRRPTAEVPEPRRPRLDDALVDEVTALVEWPVPLIGLFDTAFLELPDEALIQTMEENQRYFAVLDADGALTEAFVVVANIESSNPETVVDGNERVIRPRFEDTMFFWKQDARRRLESFRPELERVLFQEKLGSVGDKVARLEVLAPRIAAGLDGGADGAPDPEEVRLAASLCKCDLVSAIVEELPKMQGIAGREYARRDGLPHAVQEAMEQHYFPKQAGGELPTGPLARSVALADKLDTLVGIHGQGLVPSGTKDPFALRRAAIGIVRILIEGEHDLDLAELIAAAARGYEGRLDGIDEQAILAYVIERQRGYLVERGASADAVEAVLAKGVTRPLDVEARLDAIERFRTTEAASALAAAGKRIANILRKADGAVSGTIDPDALVEPAERALADALDAARPDIEARFAARDYAGAMTATATLREPVDAFFDAVMVMDEDPRLRGNRLALLARVERLCSFTAELSRLDARGSVAA